MRWLSNPELSWQRALVPPSRAEVVARVGARGRAFEVLSGGLANVNVRLGDGHVLRIYRRDSGALAKEARLLEGPWASFRVPRVVERGDDFLLLEYVAHSRLPAGAAEGRAAGLSLAEVHAHRYERAGLLGPDLQVNRPFNDLFDALRTHTEAELQRAADGAPEGLTARALARLDAREAALREASAEVTLLHGDFKASNLHWAHEGRLLVLDWEFAYAGPPLLDIGQLFRWGAPPEFVDAFAEGYWAGRAPPAGWPALAADFDLVNLAGLLAGGRDDPTRVRDVLARIDATLLALPAPASLSPPGPRAAIRRRPRPGPKAQPSA